MAATLTALVQETAMRDIDTIHENEAAFSKG
jgi:hypothetical protein